MALTKYKLGELTRVCTGGNENLRFGKESVKGISINKEFVQTKADLDGVPLNSYTVVEPKCFSFVTVTSRNGNKISIAYNNTEESFLVSSFYVTFKLSEFGKSVLLEEYLFLFFNRGEFDRYARRDSWGSAREYFYYENMSDVEIELPSIEVQKKYVDIFRAMVANQQSYERGLEDLKLVFDSEMEKIKHTASRIPLGDLATESDERNNSLSISSVYGVNKAKQFMPSVTSGEDLSKYRLVKNNMLACNLMHVGRDIVIPIAVNDDESPIIVSPAYLVFGVDESKILPHFLLMWLSRSESDRHAWFMCDSSIRSGMEKTRFWELNIPVPDLSVQKAIVEIYSVYISRSRINEKLKAQIRDICPILIKGSLEEG